MKTTTWKIADHSMLSTADCVWLHKTVRNVVFVPGTPHHVELNIVGEIREMPGRPPMLTFDTTDQNQDLLIMLKFGDNLCKIAEIEDSTYEDSI